MAGGTSFVSQSLPGQTSPGRFPSTHWSRVLAAGARDAPEAREFLATLCQAYWYPLYAYIRRRGYKPEHAQDLTQDFFAMLLERDLIAHADPLRGRFRAYLATVCARYLVNAHEHATAKKRGGGRLVVSIDSLEAEGRYARELADESTPERVFDRSWALTLLGRVLDQLRGEYDDAGKLETFDALRTVLTEGPQADAYESIAQKLGMTEGAVRVAVHRLRKRYGMLLRKEIAATVDNPADVDDEFRDLFAALQG